MVKSLLSDDVVNSDVAMSEALEIWESKYEVVVPQLNTACFQSSWESPIFQSHLDNLMTLSPSLEDRARILSSREPYTGAWLAAIPSSQLGTLLTNESFRISSALRLGCKICEPHRCPYGREVNEKGLHGLSCKFSAGRHMRHAGANDVIKRALKSAEVCSILEPSGCSTADGKRPDGLTLIPWKCGKPLVWDFTCSDTFAASYISGTSSNPGYAAKRGEIEKKKLYNFLDGRYTFIPVALETIGVWGTDGLALVKEIGRRISEVTGESRATMYLFQRLSIALQRGNAASVLGTLPPGKDLDEIYLF